MTAQTIETFDTEPTWTKIVNVWKNLKVSTANDEVYKGLKQMAKISDLVRQAQKNNKVLVFYPEGKVEESDRGVF